MTKLTNLMREGCQSIGVKFDGRGLFQISFGHAGGAAGFTVSSWSQCFPTVLVGLKQSWLHIVQGLLLSKCVERGLVQGGMLWLETNTCK